jgi:hypothetical protein
VYEASAFVPFSYEIGQDAMNFMSELGTLLYDTYDHRDRVHHRLRSGQPTGIITALAASSPAAYLNPDVFRERPDYRV